MGRRVGGCASSNDTVESRLTLHAKLHVVYVAAVLVGGGAGDHGGVLRRHAGDADLGPHTGTPRT